MSAKVKRKSERNPTMTRTKKIKLHPNHPYRKLQEKQEKERNKFPVAHPRNSAMIISFIYLFMPLILTAPVIQTKTQNPTTHQTDETSLINLLEGRGGPAVAPPDDENLEVKLEKVLTQGSPVINMSLQGVSIQETATAFNQITKTYNHLKVANTVMPTTSANITSDYGWRKPPCKGCSADHKGVDFIPGAGEPIFAVADGMIIKMGTNGGYGNYIKISHLIANSEGVIEKWETLYAHMKNNSFPEGMMIGSVVKSGDIIGAVGNTGMSTGPHLHFELLIDGKHVDPLPLLGTYKVIIVTQEEYPDYMFVGETFKSTEKIITYE